MSIELTKEAMLEDLRVTVETIEQVHPDPFLHCGAGSRSSLLFTRSHGSCRR